MPEYLQIPLAALDSDAFLGAEPIDRATWLCLLRYCFRQLNSGRIEGAAHWKNRKLEQVLAITREELHRGYKPDVEPAGALVENPALSCGKLEENLRKPETAAGGCGKFSTYGEALWAFIGDDVIVKHYPFNIERKIIANRENGRKGGRPKGS